MNYFSTALLIKVISAFIASIGFSIILKINRRHVFIGGVCGMITYVIYYTIVFFADSFFAAALVSTAFTTLFSEILARVKKAPTLVFILPGVIPTVPGGDLYRAMRCLILSDFTGAFENLLITLEIGLGIAGGIVATSTLFGVCYDTFKKIKLSPKNKSES